MKQNNLGLMRNDSKIWRIVKEIPNIKYTPSGKYRDARMSIMSTYFFQYYSQQTENYILIFHTLLLHMYIFSKNLS